MRLHGNARGRLGIHQLDSATLMLRLADVALPHELLNVFVDRGRRGETEVRTDLLEGRSVSVVQQIAADVVENLLLALGQIHVGRGETGGPDDATDGSITATEYQGSAMVPWPYGVLVSGHGRAPHRRGGV